jgi:phosphonate dehydrogenase
MKSRVAVTHWVHDEVLELLGSTCEVVQNRTRLTLPRQAVIEMSKEAQAIMVFMPDSIDEEFLTACPHLKIVAAALKGFDNFDVEACTRRGIWFSIVPDLLTVPTAELALALLLGLTRRMLEGDRLIRSGEFAGWRPHLYGTGISGATCGIIGLGAVGRALVKRLKGFDVNVLYHDVLPLSTSEEAELGVRRAPFEDLLGNSDFVFPLVSLRPSTLHLIGRKTLLLMKKGAFLINVCRGSVVNEKDVANALESGQIAGYAADVFEMEDWARTDRPSCISSDLIQNVEKTLFTPHIGSAVDSARREIAMEAARNILQALNGEVPPGAINRPAL